MKKAFRRASMLCHPDRVPEEQKQQASEQFQILREAYEQNDLAKVEEILQVLQSGGFATASEKVNDKEKLREYIAQMRQRIQTLLAEINTLKNDETYQLISTLDGNFDDYFKEKSQELDVEIQNLRQEYEMVEVEE